MTFSGANFLCLLLSGIFLPGCNFVSLPGVGIQCHSSGASDSGHESGNFTATPPYRELASQPDQHNIQKKGMESKASSRLSTLVCLVIDGHIFLESNWSTASKTNRLG